MKKHKKHFAPRTYPMRDSQGQSKPSVGGCVNHLQGSATFIRCFVDVHKHVMLLELQLVGLSDTLTVGEQMVL